MYFNLNDISYDKVDPELGLHINIPKKDVELVCLSDVHYGSKYFDNKKFDKAMDYILESKNRYVFFNGDLLEFVPPNYKISQRDQIFEPDEQIKNFIQYIKPIKKRILWLKGGNHDTARSINTSGIDIVDIMSQMLDRPYYPSIGYIILETKQRTTKLVCGHGSRCTKNPDLEINDMKFNYTGADVYLLGHDHSLYAKPVDSLIFGSSEHILRQWYVRAGNFLKFNGYARDRNYLFKRVGFASININGSNLNCITH